MSAPSDKGPIAGENLVGLLGKEQFAAVIRYTHERNIDQDDMVLFLVAMLKIFEHLFENLVRVVDAGEVGRAAFEHTIATSAESVSEVFDRNITRLATVLGAGNKALAKHRTEMFIAMGEIRALTEGLRTVTRDAREAFAAHEALRGDGHTLTDVFRTAALQALQRHVPGYGNTLREELTAEVRSVKNTVLLAGSGLAAALTLIVAAMMSRM